VPEPHADAVLLHPDSANTDAQVESRTAPVTDSLVASHIGLRVMGLAFGLISAGHRVGGATGAYLGDCVETGRMDLAEAELATVEVLCSTECEQYQALAEAVTGQPEE
jgi:hypothetical protein